MSVKHSMLALLSSGAQIAYHLKKEFEHLTVGIWPINDGQIYTTLKRLERDGLISVNLANAATDEAQSYELTEAGRAELSRWMTAVRPTEVPDRDELAIKVALALAGYGTGDEGLLTLIDAQRRDATSSLQRLTKAKAQLVVNATEYDAQCAVLDAASARYEAELRWLELIESRLVRARSRKRSDKKDT